MYVQGEMGWVGCVRKFGSLAVKGTCENMGIGFVSCFSCTTKLQAQLSHSELKTYLIFPFLFHSYRCIGRNIVAYIGGL